MTTLELAHARTPHGYTDDELLLYNDGPLLMWLPERVGQLWLLAISLMDEVGPWPFLVVGMSETHREALLQNRLTLKGAVETAEARFLLRDYGAAGALVLESVDEVPEDWMPGDVCLEPPAPEEPA